MTETATVKLAWGGTEKVTIRDGKGVIDEAASHAFTNGQCHAFAIAMHDLTGWPIIGIGGTELIGIGGTEPEYSPGHFVVYDPNLDSFVDIDGPGAEKRFDWIMRRRTEEFTREKALKPEYYQKPNLKVAKAFAQTVLQELDTLPVKPGTTNARKYLRKAF